MNQTSQAKLNVTAATFSNPFPATGFSVVACADFVNAAFEASFMKGKIARTAFNFFKFKLEDRRYEVSQQLKTVEEVNSNDSKFKGYFNYKKVVNNDAYLAQEKQYFEGYKKALEDVSKDVVQSEESATRIEIRLKGKGL